MPIVSFDPIERLLMEYIHRARFYAPGSHSHETILELAAKMLDARLTETPRDVQGQARLWAVLNREWLRKSEGRERVQTARASLTRLT
jgi:hypothetical protein